MMLFAWNDFKKSGPGNDDLPLYRGLADGKPMNAIYRLLPENSRIFAFSRASKLNQHLFLYNLLTLPVHWCINN
jgi:hypothetical protein